MHQPIDEDTNQNPMVKFIRMNTGEDIIAEIVKCSEDNEDAYILVNPLKVLYTISETKGVSIALMQWVFPRICDKQEFTIYSNDIITMCSPSKQMSIYYWNVLTKFTDIKIGSSSDIDGYEDEDEYEDIDPTEEELEYINKMLDEIKSGKRKLH